jgi:hypothetical protein
MAAKDQKKALTNGTHGKKMEAETFGKRSGKICAAAKIFTGSRT